MNKREQFYKNLSEFNIQEKPKVEEPKKIELGVLQDLSSIVKKANSAATSVRGKAFKLRDNYREMNNKITQFLQIQKDIEKIKKEAQKLREGALSIRNGVESDLEELKQLLGQGDNLAEKIKRSAKDLGVDVPDIKSLENQLEEGLDAIDIAETQKEQAQKVFTSASRNNLI